MTGVQTCALPICFPVTIARYPIDATKLNKDLGWKPSVTFEEGLAKTIDWFLENEEWLNNVTSGDYLEYYNKQYN